MAKRKPPKCDNCPNSGAVLIDDPGANPVVYCMSCLPTHLLPRVTAGHFQVLSDD